MSEPTKVKAIDLMITALEPLILENGFRKYKKGYYVRMRGEILQYIYFHTRRSPFDVRFGAIPYWAANEEYLVPKFFDLLNFKDVSKLADELDGHNDHLRWQRDPSYRRWENFNAETLQPILPLFAEKIRQYVIPMLDESSDFDGYMVIQKKLADLRGYDYFWHLSKEVVKELCIRAGNYDLVYDNIQRARLEAENEYLAEKAKAKMYYEAELAKERYENFMDRFERSWQEFTDVFYRSTPKEAFGEELDDLRAKRKEVMQKLLKLEVQ